MDPCRGHGELYFPPDGERAVARAERESAAKALCAVCPIDRQVSCLAEALAHHEEGIWGGCNDGERKVILRNRARLGV